MADLEQFTKTVHKNTLNNILLRGIGILCGLVVVNVNLGYLGASLYGLWVTIASISHWANMGDLGISNGLRNELTKAVAADDIARQKSLILTAVKMLSRIAVVIFVLSCMVAELLFATNVMESTLRLPLYITNVFFCITFVLGISRSIAYSYQKSWYTSLAQTSTTIFQILSVLLLSWVSVEPDLVVFAIVSGVGSVFGNLLIIVLMLNVFRCLTAPNIKGGYDKTYRTAILSVGLQFFVLQLCCLINYSTDSVIINKLFDSVAVTKYSVITTIYNTGDSVFSLLLISLWSAVTYAAAKNEYGWIKKEVGSILKLWMLYCLGVVFVSLLFNQIVHIWLGDSAMHYETDIVMTFCLYTIITTFGSIYVNVTNGLGRIKLQMYSGVIGSLLNIPLSVFLATTCGLGLSGIKVATLLSCYGSVILVPIDIIRFIKKKTNENKS